MAPDLVGLEGTPTDKKTKRVTAQQKDYLLTTGWWKPLETGRVHLGFVVVTANMCVDKAEFEGCIGASLVASTITIQVQRGDCASGVARLAFSLLGRLCYCALLQLLVLMQTANTFLLTV